MKTATARKLLVILVLLPLMLAVAACDAEDIAFVRALALEWAAANAGDLIKRGVLGRSGNDEVDAVMDAKDTIENIQAADQLMEEGREEGDLNKMEEAIDKRPGDYTYRVSYGAALLKNGEPGNAEAQFEAADDSVLNTYGGYHVQLYAIQGIDELSLVGQQLEANGFASTQQCKMYYERMAFFYDLRYAGEGSEFFREQRDRFAGLAAGCQ